MEPGHEDGPVVEARRKPLPVSARELGGAHQDDLAVSEEVVVRFDVNRGRERGVREDQVQVVHRESCEQSIGQARRQL